ncbi:MAG TPA: hypothetical protein VGG83_05460 [Trebonia sp.]
MTELDTKALRQALKAPHDPGDPVDVTRLMTRGRRLRHRRRLAAVAGAICAVALLAGTATAIADHTAAPSPSVRPVSPARLQPPPSPARHRAPLPVGRPTTGQPATPVPVPTALGSTAPGPAATPDPSTYPTAAAGTAGPVTATPPSGVPRPTRR